MRRSFLNVWTTSVSTVFYIVGDVDILHAVARTFNWKALKWTNTYLLGHTTCASSNEPQTCATKWGDRKTHVAPGVLGTRTLRSRHPGHGLRVNLFDGGFFIDPHNVIYVSRNCWWRWFGSWRQSHMRNVSHCSLTLCCTFLPDTAFV